MPKGRVSNVWQHYDINEECENFAVCRYCGNNISRGGMASNLKGNNTTNLWTHLRHKHADEVLVSLSPVQHRPIARPVNTGVIIKKEKTSRISKAKVAREPIRMAKPKIETHSSITGALPQKWEEYEQHEEIGEDIKDIIYSEDPLCYSPIQVIEDGSIGTKEKVTIVTSNRASTAPVVATVVSASTSSAAKTLKNNLETSIERLTTVSEQLTYVIQQQQDNQAKDDDYYFALSLVPIFRELSLTRKLYVRSKIHELLYKESEDSLSKDE
ncbi:BEAF-32 [Drosophila busckii]|uniref:BEAF-32 n=1 Tax=Drosophila busckii TaxID=30019 RepID=A0A0M5J4M5_DROBS|nr:uncharacterized protein LOC108595087 isoform X1 [Drosophila busckii]ALC41068.1 BEAF-32 [Drosophila busckii]